MKTLRSFVDQLRFGEQFTVLAGTLLCSCHVENSLMETEISLAREIMSSVERELTHDIGSGDATTNSIVSSEAGLSARIVAKEPGVIAGLSVARLAFQLLDPKISFTPMINEGAEVDAGQILAEITGAARAILSAERTALNFLGRMSGIATMTRRFVVQVRGTRARILDTRKTAPNIRACDKMAVRAGGGENHRMGLFDMILIKDNHIDFAGSLGNAVRLAREHRGELEIQVEARTLKHVAESLDLGVTRIMLDNMSLSEMREAVELARGRATLEASGNVTLANVRAIAETGVDYISVGALTHSVAALDVSLVVNRP